MSGVDKIKKELNMITYKWADVGNNEKVFLGGKYVGTIRRVDNGWQYFPQGEKGGDIFLKISECEDSLG